MMQVDFYLSFSQIDVEIRNDIDRNTKKSHLCLHRLPIRTGRVPPALSVSIN